MIHKFEMMITKDQISLSSAKYFWKLSLFYLKIFLYLLYRALSLEENASTQKFCEYAANRPDINGGRVVLGAHQQFWRTVILRHNLLSQVPWFIWFLDSRQTKVTDLRNKKCTEMIYFT